MKTFVSFVAGTMLLANQRRHKQKQKREFAFSAK